MWAHDVLACEETKKTLTEIQKYIMYNMQTIPLTPIGRQVNAPAHKVENADPFVPQTVNCPQFNAPSCNAEQADSLFCPSQTVKRPNHTYHIQAEL